MTDDDLELIRRVLNRDQELVLETDGPEEVDAKRERREMLSEKEDKVFHDWLQHNRPLTERQAAWLADAAVRLGVVSATPAANVFSSMDERKKKVELERAARVVVNSGPKVLRPPGRK